MLIHLVDLLLVLLDDKVPLDLHGRSQLPGGQGEVLGSYHEFVDLGSIGHGPLVDLLDACHDLGLDFRIVFSNKFFYCISFQTQTISPLQIRSHINIYKTQLYL